MLRRFTGRVFAAAIATALGAGSAFAVDEPENIVNYRKSFMDANGAHLSMTASIVKGEVSLTDELAPHAHALAQQAKLLTANLQQLFPEGTGNDAGLETRALPVIWERWDEFEQVAMRFEEESAKLAEVADGGDSAAIAQQMAVLGREGCANCHETFRAEQN